MYAYNTKGEEPTIPEADYFQCYDEHIISEVLLPQDGEHMQSDTLFSTAKYDTGIWSVSVILTQSLILMYMMMCSQMYP